MISADPAYGGAGADILAACLAYEEPGQGVRGSRPSWGAHTERQQPEP